MDPKYEQKWFREMILRRLKSVEIPPEEMWFKHEIGLCAIGTNGRAWVVSNDKALQKLLKYLTPKDKVIFLHPDFYVEDIGALIDKVDYNRTVIVESTEERPDPTPWIGQPKGLV